MDSETKRKLLALIQQQGTTQHDHSQAMRDRIAAAKAGTLQASPESIQSASESDQKAFDQIVMEGTGLAGGMAVKAGQGLPFVGEWLDEGFDKIQPGAGERMQQIQGAMDRQYPKTALASEIGGGIAGSIPMAIGGLGVAAKGASTVAKVGRGMALGATGGAVEGSIAGAGRDDDDRSRGAQRGGVVGLGVGGALGATAPLVADGLSALDQRAKKLDVRVIADEFGVSPSAARTVKAALENDDIAAATARLQSLGDDAMLADAGPGTASLLDAAARTGGKALRTATGASEARATTVGKRFTGILDNLLGPADGVKAAARDISQRTASARQAAYERAYGTAVDYSSDAGRAVEDVLSRVPRRTLKAAIDEANDAMQSAGIRNQQIMAQISDDGSVVFREMPNVRQLDEIKKALGNQGREAIDQFGRPTAQGIRANKLASDLRQAISDAVPTYSQAVRLGGDKIAEDQALDMGRKLLSRSTTFEDAAGMLRGASVEAKNAAKRGLREQIESTLSNVRRTITDPNTDAREAMTLVKEMSSRANVKKVRLVLGQEADQLFSEMDKAATALELRAAMAGNSATAIRQSIQGQVAAEAQPGFIRRTLGKMGNPLEGAQEITETIAGIDPRSMSEAERKVFEEVADALTRIRGAQAEKALSAVHAAMQGQPLRDEQAKLIGRAIAGSAAGSGYQSIEQSLTPPLQR